MGAIIGLIFGVISAFIAASKGFKPFRWILALGFIGFITILFLPSALAEDITDEEAEQRAMKANSIGAWMAWINVALGVLLVLILAANA